MKNQVRTETQVKKGAEEGVVEQSIWIALCPSIKVTLNQPIN